MFSKPDDYFCGFHTFTRWCEKPKRLSLDKQSPYKPVANSFVLGCYMLQWLVFVTSKISRNFTEFCAKLTMACLIVRQVALVVCDSSFTGACPFTHVTNLDEQFTLLADRHFQWWFPTKHFPCSVTKDSGSRYKGIYLPFCTSDAIFHMCGVEATDGKTWKLYQQDFHCLSCYLPQHI